MGVDTKLLLVDIDDNKLFRTLELFCSDVKNGVEVNKSRTSELQGFYSFIYKETARRLYVLKYKKEQNFTSPDGQIHVYKPEDDYPEIKGLVKNNIWWLSLGYNENAIEIMRGVGFILDGWIKENDARDSDFTKIKGLEYPENYIRNTFVYR